MSAARTARRRLGVSVTAVLAVTLGAGLLAPPAGAAPVTAPVGAPQAPSAGITVPDDVHLVSAGTTGFLGYRTVGDVPEYRWTSYLDGTSRVLGPGAVFSGGRSDTVVEREETRSGFTLHDMSVPGSAPVSLNYGDSRYGLAGVAGKTLVMSYRDHNGVLDVLLMSAPSGWSTSPTTRDVALPVDARIQRVAATTEDTALLQYARGTGSETTHHLAVVDLATGRVVETVSTGTTQPRTGVFLSDTLISWIANPAGTSPQLVTVPRGGGGPSSVPLGASPAGTQLDLALMGDWAAYALKGGGGSDRPSVFHPLTARSLTGGGTLRLLDHVDSTAPAPDGSLLVRGGSLARGEGVFRVAPGADGRPVATLVAGTGTPTRLDLLSAGVPAVADLDANGGRAVLTWDLSRSNASGTVTLRHTATGRKAERSFSYQQLGAASRLTFAWDGLVSANPGDLGGFAPAGDYTWELKAVPLNGIGPQLTRTGTFKVARKTGAHDYTGNGSPDLLARDASGQLVRDDTVKVAGSHEVYSTGRVRIGVGWGIYDRLEAVGDVAGGTAPDLVARDSAGVLWSHLGKGDGTFAARTRVGAGWKAYDKITGGSDLDGDGRSDLLATDTSGVLWYYRATGDWRAPFAGRVRVGAGWGGYNQITALGDVAGTSRGDLVARDTAGVLWLFQGSGTGQFAARVRIGAGWGAFTHLVGVGDADRDGRNDLYAVGPSGSRLYAGTGNAAAPFQPPVYSSVNSDAARFDTVF
ncbi:FG-GAP repeat domain-containing protein [Streptomyces sp. NPDC059247]|uniref:FG-GAP repeat domain-containing protein n=1 Tax=Streptomyces sp. NPDC059247 TaxID=3346790 RepID=UPI0036BDD71E